MALPGLFTNVKVLEIKFTAVFKMSISFLLSPFVFILKSLLPFATIKVIEPLPEDGEKITPVFVDEALKPTG